MSKRFSLDKSNERILKSIGKLENAEIDTIVNSTAEEVEANFDCLTCANCCKTKGPAFTKKDINRIARHLEIEPQEFVDKNLMFNENDDMVLQTTPCLFLEADNKCRIYEIRPKACASYPHLYSRNVKNLFPYMIAHAETCPIIQEVIDESSSKL